MKIIISLVLIFSIYALECNIYDYSKGKIACALACPSGTTLINNNLCLTDSQFLIDSQVFICRGIVSSDRTVCCGDNKYLEGNQCLDCHGQIYNNGFACCPNDHYLDYSKTVPNCVQILSGNCPNIIYSSPFKVCCPNQQLYNVATGKCSATFGLNCDQNLLACCPSGQMLDYS